MPVLWILLAAVMIFLVAFAAIRSFREKLLGAWRNSRGDKGIFRQLNTSRLIQAFAMGVSSGLQTEEALELSAELLCDVPGAKMRCETCRNLIDEGKSLNAAMQESGMLPAASCRLMELGQKSGTMDATVEKIAADLSEESEFAIEAMVGKVEPALVLVCALLVGLILLSVMLPLMHIMSAIG